MKYILGLMLLASGLAHGAATGGDLHFAQASYSVQQSAKAVTVVVDRTGGTSGAVSVHYATAFGTAWDGINYMNKYGDLTWAAGDSSPKSFTVQLGTAWFAGSREFSVKLSSASNATLTAPSTSTVTIVSSSSSLTGGDLHFAQASYSVQQSAKAVTVVVDRTGGTSGAVSVHYATAYGTALDGINYMNKYGELTWAAGDSSSKSFTVALGTASFAGSREFSVKLSSASNATLTAPSTSTVTIVSSSSSSTLPDGAVALGYYNQLFYDEPTLAEVSTSMTATNAKWYTIPTNTGYLSTQGSEFGIALGGGVVSQAHRGREGALPYVSGAQGFYVEFAMHLSSNNNDHFEGLYLQTAEHTMGLDHLATDPAGFERWTEIDVTESGYGAGSLATVINYWGTAPNFSRTVWNDWGLAQSPLDYTKEHIYGVSYDPATNVLQWYIDNVPTFSKSPTGSTIKNWHYYLVMESSSHGAHTPYDTIVRYVAAYTK